jgi:hypothetical protein
VTTETQLPLMDVQLIDLQLKQAGCELEEAPLMLMFEHFAQLDIIRITQQIQRIELQFEETVKKLVLKAEMMEMLDMVMAVVQLVL